MKEVKVLKETVENDVRRLRFQHNEMSQEELAKRIGCTRQTIIALEKGRYIPSLLLAFQIAEVFGKSIEEVFFHVKEEKE